MTTAKASDHVEEGRSSRPDLQNRYGRIGISAVVAVLPYRGESKNSAYAPAEARD